MIMQTLWNFQKILYQNMIANEELLKLVNGVFYKVPQDTKFPYIQITLDKVKNSSVKEAEGIKFIVDINIFSKESGNKNLLAIASILETIFANVDYDIENWKLVSFTFQSGAISKQNDGVSQVMNLKFDALMRKGKIYGSL